MIDDRRFYVYILYRDVEMTDPFYVGKGCDRRISTHEIQSVLSRGNNFRKENTIKKLHTELGFVPKRIFKDGLLELEAFSLEIRLISEYGRLDIKTGCLTNLSEGGLGSSKSPETRAKIKAARARQIFTLETREKMGAAARGRRHSDETKAKMSAAKKWKPSSMSSEGRARQIAAVTGRKHTAEARESMSITRTGKKLSAEHVAAIANGNRGLKRSAQARANISAGKTGTTLSEEHKRNISKVLSVYNGALNG